MGTLIHSRDQSLFHSIAVEVNRLAGMLCYYYRMDLEASVRDPLYGEMSEPTFKDIPDGLQMPCFSTNPDHATTTGEEGRRTQWDSQIWIARLEWESLTDSTEPPRNGDIVNAWGNYYDVVDTTKDGVMDDNRRVFTLWKLNLTRKTKFETWRRKEI